MINITKQHVDNFREWKSSLRDQFDLMQNVIEEAEPKKYKTNPFYIMLDESKESLENMVISTEKIEYYSTEVSTNFEFGRYLVEYWQKIKVKSRPNHIHAAMVRAENDLFKIFEDL